MQNLTNLTKEEQKQLEEIRNAYYMPPLIEKLEKEFFLKYGVIESLDYMNSLISSCKDDVEIILKKRKDKGQIKDIPQARKAVVGNIFQRCIMYIFFKSKNSGLVPHNLCATTKTKSKLFEKHTSIKIGEETQKPDMDLIFYKLDKKGKFQGCIIVSLKTSLRERAGQTYKWKLLLEIATSNNEIKDKYNICFDVKNAPKVCFATINFYDEINQPQHRGMFKFFDGSFIGKPIENNFIQKLSNLFKFAQENI